MVNLQKASELCKVLELVAPTYGYHIGLTGGCLYKSGDRKDIDILIYSIRQVAPDFEGLLTAFGDSGLEIKDRFGFVTKAVWCGFNVDILYPEYGKEGQYYPSESNDAQSLEVILA